MSSSPSRTGGDFLSWKSDLSKSRREMPELADFLIVEDFNLDADRLRATLHAIFGYGIKVRRANTIGNALDLVIESRPDVIFLDDYLRLSARSSEARDGAKSLVDTAHTSVPFLRRCGYEGPIIVVSGEVTQRRRAELRQLGITEIIHKDDVDTGRVTEALTHVFKPAAAPGA